MFNIKLKYTGKEKLTSYWWVDHLIFDLKNGEKVLFYPNKDGSTKTKGNIVINNWEEGYFKYNNKKINDAQKIADLLTVGFIKKIDFELFLNYSDNKKSNFEIQEIIFTIYDNEIEEDIIIEITKDNLKEIELNSLSKDDFCLYDGHLCQVKTVKEDRVVVTFGQDNVKTVDLKDLVLVKADNFLVIRQEMTKDCPARHVAKDYLDELKIDKEYYSYVEDRLTDFLNEY